MPRGTWRGSEGGQRGCCPLAGSSCASLRVVTCFARWVSRNFPAAEPGKCKRKHVCTCTAATAARSPPALHLPSRPLTSAQLRPLVIMATRQLAARLLGAQARLGRCAPSSLTTPGSALPGTQHFISWFSSVASSEGGSGPGLDPREVARALNAHHFSSGALAALAASKSTVSWPELMELMQRE